MYLGFLICKMSNRSQKLLELYKIFTYQELSLHCRGTYKCSINVSFYITPSKYLKGYFPQMCRWRNWLSKVKLFAYLGNELVMKLGFKHWSDSKTSTFSFHLRECQGYCYDCGYCHTVTPGNINNNALSREHRTFESSKKNIDTLSQNYQTLGLQETE